MIVDTQSFLWFTQDSPRLSVFARGIIMEAERALLSRASAWEIAIKVSIGELPLRMPLKRLLEEVDGRAFEFLEIKNPHLLRVAELPYHHRDPFDRMIVAQALEERLGVVSSDDSLDVYGIRRHF